MFFNTQNPKALAQGLYEESSTQKHLLGTRVDLADGRSFIYALNDAVALAAGKLCQVAVPVANHLNCAVAAAAAIGAQSVSVTLGATASTANEYREGFLHINDATGEGYTYKVKKHAAIASAGTGTFYIEDDIRVALTTSSEVTLTKHPCDSVVVMPTTQTGMPIGVPLIAVTAAYYFWLQVKGPCAVLANGTLVIGNGVAPSVTTAGAVDPEAATHITSRVGTVMRVNASTEYALINLSVPGF